MKKLFMALALGSVLALGACGGGGSSDNGGANNGATTADGEAIYKDSCASCHGADLAGGAGPALDTVGADHSVDDILEVIENGQGSMPPGLVTGDDAQAVSEWLAEHK